MTEMVTEQTLIDAVQTHRDGLALTEAARTALVAATSGSSGGGSGDSVVGGVKGTRPLLFCRGMQTTSLAGSDISGTQLLKALCRVTDAGDKLLDKGYTYLPSISFVGKRKWSYVGKKLSGPHSYHEISISGLFLKNTSDIPITRNFKYRYTSYIGGRRLYIGRVQGANIGWELLHEVSANQNSEEEQISTITVSPGERCVLVSFNGALYGNSQLVHEIDGIQNALGNGLDVDVVATNRAHQKPLENINEIWGDA